MRTSTTISYRWLFPSLLAAFLSALAALVLLGASSTGASASPRSAYVVTVRETALDTSAQSINGAEPPLGPWVLWLYVEYGCPAVTPAKATPASCT